MWEELGIPETSDPKAIRKAYAARLKSLNRTGGDLAFARLHAAYQQAIAWTERNARPEAVPPSSEVVYLQPAPPPAQPPTPDAEALSILDARIGALLQAGEFQDAVDAFDQGLARGVLPLGSGSPLLEQIMDMAVKTLAPAPFIALARRVGWDRPAQRGSWYTPARQAVATRLEAEIWVENLEREAKGGGERQPAKDTKLLRRFQLVLLRRRHRRNARLLLIDRPQLIRISKGTISDLQGKMAMFQRYEGLAQRFPEAAIQRAQWMLDFDTKWGKTVRRTVGWLVVLAIFIGISILWDSKTAVRTLFAGFVVLWILMGLRGLYRLLKKIKPAWAAWLSVQKERLIAYSILLAMGVAFLKLMNWISGENDIFGGPFPWVLLGVFCVSVLSDVKKRGRR